MSNASAHAPIGGSRERGRSIPHPGRVIVLTDRSRADAAGHDLPSVVRAAAEGGSDAVIFREKDLDGDERLALGLRLVEALGGTDTLLIVASDVALAEQLGAWGVHLAQGEEAIDAHGNATLAVGRSCHNRDEVAAAVGHADYITVSPVFATDSKPGYGPALGPAGAVALSPDGDGMSEGDSPVAYGLGGITAENAASCLRAGLSGIAVMGAVMASSDPSRATAGLVAATATLAGVRP